MWLHHHLHQCSSAIALAFAIVSLLLLSFIAVLIMVLFVLIHFLWSCCQVVVSWPWLEVFTGVIGSCNWVGAPRVRFKQGFKEGAEWISKVDWPTKKLHMWGIKCHTWKKKWQHLPNKPYTLLLLSPAVLYEYLFHLHHCSAISPWLSSPATTILFPLSSHTLASHHTPCLIVQNCSMATPTSLWLPSPTTITMLAVTTSWFKSS